MSDTNRVFNIYVPFDGAALFKIKRGSAVVDDFITFDELGPTFTVDFEGGIYENLSFVHKLNRAAYRHVTKYPTVARMVTNYKEVVKVGFATYGNDWKLLEIHIFPECQKYLIDWIS
jgi:hypothetical protein